MNDKEKLLKRLSKKYHGRVQDFYQESDLIDNCKYMLYFSNGFTWHYMDTMPCKSITEAIYFIKASDIVK